MIRIRLVIFSWSLGHVVVIVEYVVYNINELAKQRLHIIQGYGLTLLQSVNYYFQYLHVNPSSLLCDNVSSTRSSTPSSCSTPWTSICLHRHWQKHSEWFQYPLSYQLPSSTIDNSFPMSKEQQASLRRCRCRLSALLNGHPTSATFRQYKQIFMFMIIMDLLILWHIFSRECHDLSRGKIWMDCLYAQLLTGSNYPLWWIYQRHGETDRVV
jgi:hypothetical protein